MSAPDVVIVGGYSEPRSAMERIGSAAETMGIWANTKSFTLPEVWNQESDAMEAIAQADELAGHSSAIMAIHAIARNIGGNIRGINSFNGPELPVGEDGEAVPWTRRGLVAASSQKTRNHLKAAVEHIRQPGSNEEARLRVGLVIGNGLQLARRMNFHWRMLGEIRNFSTAAAFVDAADAGVRKLNDINSEHDEFFPPIWKPLDDLKTAQAMLLTVPHAHHDELITDPEYMLGVAEEVLAR